MLVLWDLTKRSRLGVFDFPMPAAADFGSWLSRDGAYVAASAVLEDGKKLTCIWQVKNAKMIHEFAEYSPALAFSADGLLLARSFKDGTLSVATLVEGKAISATPRSGDGDVTGIRR